jgi:Mrp family chromosome partitioning ATPase/capsular polysaccharide biosynthesis protein
VWVEPHADDALDSYLRAVRAHGLLVTAVFLATLLATVAWLSQRSPVYKATAHLVINPLPQGDETFLGLPVIVDSGDPTRTMQTAAALLESPAAARATSLRLGGNWTAQRVLGHVDVEPAGESNILAVTAKAGTGKEAAQVANVFAAATLRQRAGALRRATSAVIDRLVKTRAGLVSTDPRVSSLDSRIGLLNEVRIAGDPTAELSRPATSWKSAAGAPASLVLLIALGAGLILGSTAALLTERLSPPTIRAEEELDEVDEAPVLARIPSMRSLWPARARRAAGGELPPPPVPESFRNLELQLREQAGEHRVVLFTSPSSGDGKTTCVINFAHELAGAEQTVILFDLNLRRPALASTLGVVQQSDLRLVFAAGAGLANVLADVPGAPMIRVVPGIADAAGTKLEQVGRRLPELIAEARTMASYVLVDTPALGEVGDALRFAAAVDDVILVARLNNTRVADVETVRDLLHRAGKPATGYVLLSGRLARQKTRRPRLRGDLRRARERPAPEPASPGKVRPPGAPTSITDLIAAGLLEPGAELVAMADGRQHTAYVRGEQIDVNGATYSSLSAAASSVTGKHTNGWTFWHARVEAGDVPLAQLRSELDQRA